MRFNYGFWKAIKENGLSQKEYAALVGVHETVISRIINGYYNVTKIQRIKYSKALGKSPDELFPEQ